MTVTIEEAQARLPELIDQLARGGALTITRGDRPVAQIVPPPVEPQDEWERRLLGIASDCGVSLPHSALSSEEFYE